MTLDEAYEAVHQAMLSVDPEYAGQPDSVGGIGVRTVPRGQRFDVFFSGSGRLFSEFDAAVRKALGEFVGTVTEAGSSRGVFLPNVNVGRDIVVASTVVPPTIYNYN